MGRLAALGERTRIAGFALAGALVLPAEDEAAVRAAWRALPADVAVVVLTPAAAATLGTASYAEGAPLRVVLPW